VCGGTETDCGDSLDNNNNGFTDCDDFNCAGTPACTEGEGAAEGGGEGSKDGEGTLEGEGEGIVDGEGVAEGEGMVDGEGVPEGEGAVDGEGIAEGDGEGAVVLSLPYIATEVLLVFDAINLNGDALLSSNEALSFIVGLIENAKGDAEAQASTYFSTLDKNNDDALTVGELRSEAGAASAIHAVDSDGDGAVTLAEVLRAVQLYNAGGYACAANAGATEDGYAPTPGGGSCVAHTGDYAPQDFNFSLSELLRIIQLYNFDSLDFCPLDGSEDGFCPGA
jgi:Ca2+-binding EF-hand superfamily protein